MSTLSSHHQQSLVGVNDAQPNGHVGVLTVLQEGTDGYVSALGVRLSTTQTHREEEQLVQASKKTDEQKSAKCNKTDGENQ